MAAQEIIKRGARWRTGTGDQVNLWLDPWLPDSMHPFIETPSVVGLQDMTMDSLKSVTGLSWDENILRDLFNSRDQLLFNKFPQLSDLHKIGGSGIMREGVSIRLKVAIG